MMVRVAIDLSCMYVGGGDGGGDGGKDGDVLNRRLA